MIILSCKDYFNPTNENNYIELFSLGETNSDSRLNSRGDKFTMEEFVEFNFLNDVNIKNIGSRFKRSYLKINRILYPKTVLQNYGRLQKKL